MKSLVAHHAFFHWDFSRACLISCNGNKRHDKNSKNTIFNNFPHEFPKGFDETLSFCVPCPKGKASTKYAFDAKTLAML